MFITFEGPDGSGKSTQAVLTYARCIERGLPTVLTREPGGTAIGDQIRSILTDLHNIRLMPNAELLLFSASRAQIVHEIIRPHLGSGYTVLCDRFFDSTYAYQGYGHRLDMEVLRQITEFATGGLRPDLTFLLDIEPEESLRRRILNNDEWNRIDDMALAFHRRVREGYLKLTETEPQRWTVINAMQGVDAVQAEIQARLALHLA